jgi:uncharacterized membrane protein
MDETLVLVTFEQDSRAYQALSDIKTLDASSHVALREAAVVRRDVAGVLSLADDVDPQAGTATVTGGLVGLLIGALAGPVGVLLGGTIGLLGGGFYDYDSSEDADSVLERIAHDIPNGSTALVAALGEYGFEATDSAMQTLGGSVSRYSRADVEAEVAAAQKAARKARREARKTLRRSRRKAAHDKVHAKLEQMRATLHAGRETPAQH